MSFKLTPTRPVSVIKDGISKLKTEISNLGYRFALSPLLFVFGLAAGKPTGAGARCPLHLATDPAQNLDLVGGDAGASEEAAQLAEDSLRAQWV